MIVVETKEGRNLKEMVLIEAIKMSSREINKEVDRLLDLGEFEKARLFANIWLRRNPKR